MPARVHISEEVTNLPKTQKAAQYMPETNSIAMNFIPVPTPSKDELLVKIASASLCHSDLMHFEPNKIKGLTRDTPFTIGHEATGIIISVPESCTNDTLKVGAKIGFLCCEQCCYECEGCKTHNQWCLDGKTVMSGFGRDGFFQEYATMHWRNAIVLPESMDILEAAPLFCAGVTSVS